MIVAGADERALDVLAQVTGLTRSLLEPDPGGIEASLRASTVLKAMKAFAAVLMPTDDAAPARVWIPQSDDAQPVEYVRADIAADLALRGRLLGIIEAMDVAAPPMMHRKGPPGMWRQRRAQIASDIRGLLASGPSPEEILTRLPPHLDDWND
jgi:hypothetical protein